MRADIRVALYAAAVVVLAACAGGGNDQEAAPPSSPKPAAVKTAGPAPASPSAAPSPSPSPPATVDFAMPNFKGKNLQDAQDAVQALGVFYSISHDLRGSRSQVLDSNWQVCTQTPAAGTRVQGLAADHEGKIDFGVVKLTETCP